MKNSFNCLNAKRINLRVLVCLVALFFLTGCCSAPINDEPIKDERIIKYKKILESNPNSSEAYRMLGALYGLNKNYKKARHHLKKSLKINPNQDKNCVKTMNAILMMVESAQSPASGPLAEELKEMAVTSIEISCEGLMEMKCEP